MHVIASRWDGGLCGLHCSKNYRLPALQNSTFLEFFKPSPWHTTYFSSLSHHYILWGYMCDEWQQQVKRRARGVTAGPLKWRTENILCRRFEMQIISASGCAIIITHLWAIFSYLTIQITKHHTSQQTSQLGSDSSQLSRWWPHQPLSKPDICAYVCINTPECPNLWHHSSVKFRCHVGTSRCGETPGEQFSLDWKVMIW